MRYPFELLGAAGLLALVVALPVPVHGEQAAVQAQEQPQEQRGHEHQGGGGAKPDGTAERRPGMMNPDMMKMMSDMKVRDAKLQALVQTMNAAKGAKKTDAIAALLTALVEDREAMCSSMMGAMGAHGGAGHDKPKQ